jgi:thiaminase/transcriptional activator TenA
MPPLSQRLRDANRLAWDEMQAHRFVRDIEADTLPREVFGRYLVYEQGFVETAILIFGHALLKAPDFSARRFLCTVLNGLGGQQLDYFDRVMASLGVRPAARSARPPAAVAAFDRGMLRIAETGDFTDVVTIMLAAEWMYATWCSRPNRRAVPDPDIADWVRLHAQPAFLTQVDWLRGQLDASEVDEAAFGRLAGLFGQALRLEIGFHAAPYEGLLL